MNKQFTTKKHLTISVILLLAVVAVVGAAYAKYITTINHKFDLNVNAYGELAIALCEGQDKTQPWTGKQYQIVPGTEVEYNPYVLVRADSEACFLYVEVAESIRDGADFGDYISYSVADGWTKGDGDAVPSNIYYREVESKTDDQFFGIIAGDQVNISEEVTKDMMSLLMSEDGEALDGVPEMKIAAYAVQKTKLNDPQNESPVAAWGWLENKMAFEPVL